jgi:hypothetical protein
MSVDENEILKGLKPEAGRTGAAASPMPSRDPCRPVGVIGPPEIRKWLTKRASAAPDPKRSGINVRFPQC